MYILIHVVINSFISYTFRYLKAVFPKLLFSTNNILLSRLSLSTKKHTCIIPENHHRLGSERACYFIENNLKSGSWACYQWKLKDNFQSKAASGSLGLAATPVLRDETCLGCSPVLWPASVVPSRILQLAGVCALCLMIMVPGLPELQNCTENRLAKC